MGRDENKSKGNKNSFHVCMWWKKEDWWFYLDDTDKIADLNLINEFKKETGQDFYMTDYKQFLIDSNNYLGGKIKEDAINETSEFIFIYDPEIMTLHSMFENTFNDLIYNLKNINMYDLSNKLIIKDYLTKIENIIIRAERYSSFDDSYFLNH